MKRVFRARFQILSKGFRSSIFANLAPKSPKFDEKTVLKLQNRKFFFKIAKIATLGGAAAEEAAAPAVEEEEEEEEMDFDLFG